MSQYSVWEADPTLRSRIEQCEGVLLCLDFDGTLAPISESPDEPKITSENRRALREIAVNPRSRIAIISGRALSDLPSRIGIPNIVYAGNHGLEIKDGDTATVHPVAARHSSTIQRADSVLRRKLATVPGMVIENKELSLTVHYRQVPRSRVPDVERAVTSVESTFEMGNGAEPGPPFRIVPGKQSFEIRLAVDWNKGNAVDLLKNRVSNDWITIYVGDDTTDEDAFEVLDPMDIGVFVGTEPTTATYRLTEQREVSRFLEWIARML